MKKLYIDPEFEVIEFRITDIIAGPSVGGNDGSLATGSGDNETKAPDDWWG